MLLICKTQDIPERDARSFTTPMGDIIITQRDGQFFAYKNSCPHLGISLEFQEQQFMDMDHEFLMCANHGALFQVDTGRCVFGPCMNEHLSHIAIEVHSDGGFTCYPAAQVRHCALKSNRMHSAHHYQCWHCMTCLT